MMVELYANHVFQKNHVFAIAGVITNNIVE